MAGFTFGSNWRSYSAGLTEDQLQEATEALRSLVGSLDGLSVCDVGCGSGIHSIAAARLGATHVLAVDIDPLCVGTTRDNCRRFGVPGIEVRQGSALDPNSFTDQSWDLVYAWGVLHHTGAMWRAITAVAGLVAPGGRMVLSIYNRAPGSAFWRRVKSLYNGAPFAIRRILELGLFCASAGARLIRGRSPLRRQRGMTVWHDAVDWLGGWPYECASAGEVEAACGRIGLQVIHRRLVAPQRLGLRHWLGVIISAGLLYTGCNEFVLCGRKT